MRIMPLGDSITYGIQTSFSNGYRKPLYEALTAAGYSIKMVGSERAGHFPEPLNEGHPPTSVAYRTDTPLQRCTA